MSIISASFKRSKSIVGACVVLAFGLVFASCGGSIAETRPAPTAVPKANLIVSGAGGASQILQLLADRYQLQHSDLDFEFLDGSGSGGGVKGVATGQLDLGAMSRPPKDAELSSGAKYLKLASDGVAIVVSQDVPVTQLSSDQVRGIFQGNITNWSEVSSHEGVINVFVREEEDSNTKILRDGLFGNEKFGDRVQVVTSESAAQSLISNAADAIGYLAYGSSRIANVPVRAVAIDGYDPNAIDGSYPYLRQIGVAYLPANASKVQPFLDFVKSQEAKELLTTHVLFPAD